MLILLMILPVTACSSSEEAKALNDEVSLLKSEVERLTGEVERLRDDNQRLADRNTVLEREGELFGFAGQGGAKSASDGAEKLSATEAPAQAPHPDDDIKIPEGKGLLRLDCNIDADVFLSGKKIGHIPILNKFVPAGEHTLQIHCDHCIPPQRHEFPITIPEGEKVAKYYFF